MQICIAILNEIRVVVEFIIDLIQWVVETVCTLVTTVIRTVREVCEEVCGWLGPFSFLCDWVCRLIEVVETVVEWVCEEILVGIIIGFIRVVFEYVFYILTWVCWVIDWIPRAFDLLFCALGFQNRRNIHLCLKILTETRDTMTWTLEEVAALVQETQDRFEQCNINVCVIDTEIIETVDHRTGLTCGFGNLFGSDHHWFSRRQCLTSTVIPVTVYFVEDIVDARGCSVPGTNYILVDRDATNATIAHEIGHLADLWTHDSDPLRIMVGGTTNASVIFSSFQCCMIRTSRYVTTLAHPLCRIREPILRRLTTILTASHLRHDGD